MNLEDKFFICPVCKRKVTELYMTLESSRDNYISNKYKCACGCMIVECVPKKNIENFDIT